jgi:putative ABC transport system permease protein
MIWENLKMAMASITSAKLRSFLTMLGIIIGIASVVAINAVGAGVKMSVSSQIGDLGTNIITVTSGATVTTDKDGKKTLNPSASAGTSTLTSSDIERIKELEHITAVAPLDLVSGIASRDTNQARGALIIATTPDYQVIRNQKFDQGRFIADSDDKENVAVLGAQAKKDLFGDESSIDKSFTIRSTTFRVIGELTSTDTGTSALSGPSFDSAIYIPVGAAQNLTKDTLQILRIMAQADSTDQVKPGVERIRKAMLDNHGGQEDFSVLTQEDLIGTVGDILDLLATFIAAIASIALLVGGIGIMNIMLVSVTERTREIGIRKALGATRRMILSQFLIEAAVISLFGGILGMLAAVGMGIIISRVAKITPVFSINSFTLAVSVSVGIGIIFGLMPAIKASRKRPIDALRYE